VLGYHRVASFMAAFSTSPPRLYDLDNGPYSGGPTGGIHRRRRLGRLDTQAQGAEHQQQWQQQQQQQQQQRRRHQQQRGQEEGRSDEQQYDRRVYEPYEGMVEKVETKMEEASVLEDTEGQWEYAEGEGVCAVPLSLSPCVVCDRR
jgi:hypothetical protein